MPDVQTAPFGPYDLVRSLGKGAMGAVYLARRRETAGDFALKILLGEDLPWDVVQRFEREARMAMALDHPNLVKGFEFGEIDNRMYYTMEYVPGCTAASLLSKNKYLEAPLAVRIVRQVGSALHEMHLRGYVHRDVKPGNILVTESGVAKLFDLGLAKSLGRERADLTQPGGGVGTPRYMSPEQVIGAKITPRSDIYSLGATLYHFLTGQAPFDAEDTMQVFQKQMKNQLQPPEKLRPGLPSKVLRVLKCMMAKDSRSRYPSAEALLQDL